MIYEIDTHTHTLASGHAYNTITEMIQAAVASGLKMLSITDHGPAIPGAPDPIYFSNYPVIPRKQQGITVLMGVELNIIDTDGNVDLSERILKKQDITLASFHKQTYKNAGIEANTNGLIRVIQNPYIDILGHPDDSDMPIDYEQVVPLAAQTGTIFEVNENSFRSPTLRRNSAENIRTFVRLCKTYQVPVVIGSDAHYTDVVGEHFRAEKLLIEEEFPENLILNTDAEKLFAYLQKRREAR